MYQALMRSPPTDPGMKVLKKLPIIVSEKRFRYERVNPCALTRMSQRAVQSRAERVKKQSAMVALRGSKMRVLSASKSTILERRTKTTNPTPRAVFKMNINLGL